MDVTPFNDKTPQPRTRCEKLGEDNRGTTTYDTENKEKEI